MGVYDKDTNNFGHTQTVKVDVTTRRGATSLLTKSFLYMFLFLLLSAAVSVIVHFIFVAVGFDDYSGTMPQNVYNAYLIMMLVTLGVQLLLTIVMAFTARKSGKGTLVCMILYSVCMGVFISSFTFILNWWTLLSCFAITSLAFAGMAIIGATAKKVSGLAMVASGLFIVALFMSIFNIFMFIFLPGVWLIQNCVTSGILCLAILLIVAVDVHNIKKISDRCPDCDNMALYFAFNLYLDFIIILIYVLRIVAIFGNRR